LNAEGPELVKNLSVLEPLTPEKFKKALEKDDHIVLDVRSYDSFGAQHIENSYNIDFGGNMPTFAGWIIPPEKNILIVADDEDKARETVIWLRRVGLDNSIGYLGGELPEWAKAGYRANHHNIISSPEFVEKYDSDKNLNLLDVRASGEYEENHIEGSINIPAPELRTRYEELDKNKHYYIICSTGHRSGTACSILHQKGFKNITNIGGGMTGYGNLKK
jgi:rhodanese-related sulfurtransferase